MKRRRESERKLRRLFFLFLSFASLPCLFFFFALVFLSFKRPNSFVLRYEIGLLFVSVSNWSSARQEHESKRRKQKRCFAVRLKEEKKTITGRPTPPPEHRCFSLFFNKKNSPSLLHGLESPSAGDGGLLGVLRQHGRDVRRAPAAAIVPSLCRRRLRQRRRRRRSRDGGRDAASVPRRAGSRRRRRRRGRRRRGSSSRRQHRKSREKKKKKREKAEREKNAGARGLSDDRRRRKKNENKKKKKEKKIFSLFVFALSLFHSLSRSLPLAFPLFSCAGMRLEKKTKRKEKQKLKQRRKQSFERT